MFDDTPESRNAVTALSGQLSQRVALDNPALEPDTLTQMLVEGIFPTKAATAPTAEPALRSVTALSVVSHLR